MRYASAGAFRAALEARLNDEQSEGVGISRLRKRVVFERLLARLQAVAPDDTGSSRAASRSSCGWA